MSQQSKISFFLKPIQQKRSVEIDTPQVQQPSPKKLKSSPEKKLKVTSENEENEPTNPSPALSNEKPPSPDLKEKHKLVSIETNGLLVNIGATWYDALAPEFKKPYFEKLSKFVSGEREKHTVYPPASQVWSWTRTGDISKVKVVILGQDPYHGPKQAHGLCFSVQAGVASPPSLVNMYKALQTDIPGFTRPTHGNLTGWAKQGVLLLNAVLTVQAHKANSHKDMGWEKLTDAVISWINNNTTGVVFMLWGSYAQKKGARINQSRHHILKGVHPSPLSAHRGFFECQHFSKCNTFLKEQGKKPIDWTDLPESATLD